MVMSVTRSIRDSRRADAEKRQALYDKKTLQEKLDGLPKGGAKKQRAKLEAALLAKQAKPQETAPKGEEKVKKPYQKKAKD
jgi:hypothetical protein